MPIDSRLSKVAAPTLFFLGLLCLAAMAFATAWPDMEASVFDRTTALMADGKLRALRCPWVIAADEVAAVRIRFTNNTDRPASFLVRTRISEGFVTFVRQDSQPVKLQPNQSRELSWPVTAKDAAFGRVVMARALATRSAFRPARENSCGILVVGISGVDGQSLFAAGVLVGLVLTAAGAGWWWSRRRPLGTGETGTVRHASILALIVVASLVSGMLSWWLVSHLLLIAAVLFSFVLLELVAAPNT